MHKGAELSDRFARIVKPIADTEGLSLEQSAREARNPNLVRAMNSV
jgi:hypothetical protein